MPRVQILRNRSFEEGHWLGPTGVTPNEYRIAYTEGVKIEHVPTLKPESSVGNILQVPPHERDLFFVDGPHCLKVFKDHAPLQAAVIQDEVELVPGKRYRAVAHVYIDVIKGYDSENRKIPPERGSYAARVRLQVGPSGAVWPDPRWQSCDWYSEGEIWPFYLERHELVWEFTAREGDGAVAVELEAKWGNRNGFFLDALSLVCLDEEPAPQPQPPAVTGPVMEAPFGCKAGFHTILDDGVTQMLKRLSAAEVPAPFVKIQDDVRWAQAAREASPNSVIMMRFHSGLEGCQNVATSDLDRMADGLLGVILEKLEKYPHLKKIVNFWEICNEPDPPGVEGYRALGRLMIKCMEKAEAVGLKLALFSLNNGTPEWDEMVAMVETGVFGRAKRGGHILALHEGIVWEDKPIDHGYGEPIPGAPPVEGAGAYCFRSGYLYRLLAERNEVIPLVISEFYAAKYNDPAAALERFKWYDEKASQVPYLVAFLPFTTGGINAGWDDQDYGQVYEQGLIDYMVAIKDRANARMPSEPDEPTVDYEVTVHVPAQTLESYDAVHEIARESFGTVAAYDDAGRLANVKCPSGEGGKAIIYDVDDEEPFVEYFGHRYPLTRLEFARTMEPTIWDRDISAELDKNGEWPEQTELWKGLVLHHTLSSSPHATATYCAFQKEAKTVPGIQYSIWITQTGEILLTEKLDRMVRHLGVMPERRLPVGLEGNLDKHWPPEPMLDAMVRVCKWAIQNPAMEIELETITGHDDHSKTACPGWRSGWKAEFYRRLRKALGVEEPKKPMLVGLHDQTGGEWMVGQGLIGLCVTHAQVQRVPRLLDYVHLQEKGITVICRLVWGYADGTGTLPRSQDLEAHVQAVVDTIVNSRGVDYWQLWNEPNNRQEWPGFGSGGIFTLTPSYVSNAYNAVWNGVAGRAKIGPPPIDPYFGPNSDNSVWWRYILDHIAGANALFLHCKTQTNNVAEIRSLEKFGDWPLQWQYLHLNTVVTSLEMVPSRFRELPVFATEVNPQCKHVIGGETGWLPDNGAWVLRAADYLRELGIDGIAFYRYEAAGDQTPFAMENKSALLEAIKEEAGRGIS